MWGGEDCPPLSQTREDLERALQEMPNMLAASTWSSGDQMIEGHSRDVSKELGW